jgi:hypothetical protein
MFIQAIRHEGGEPLEVSKKLFDSQLKERGWRDVSEISKEEIEQPKPKNRGGRRKKSQD